MEKKLYFAAIRALSQVLSIFSDLLYYWDQNRLTVARFKCINCFWSCFSGHNECYTFANPFPFISKSLTAPSKNKTPINYLLNVLFLGLIEKASAKSNFFRVKTFQ